MQYSDTESYNRDGFFSQRNRGACTATSGVDVQENTRNDKRKEDIKTNTLKL